MKSRRNYMQEIMELAHEAGVVSAADVRSRGIHSEYLRRLRDQGRLIRIGRGLYQIPESPITTQHGLVLATKAVPKGIICLLSALRYHEIGTEAPRAIWMALDRRTAAPKSRPQKMRFVYFSGAALTEGVVEHTIEGAHVHIYSPAKTVADCFKYRNKIGLDVALEALQDVVRNQKCPIDDLWKYAKICRVAKTMRPYLEATV